MLTGRRFAPCALALALALHGSSARAEDACNAAYEDADLLVHGKTSAKLLEARDDLHVCSAASCKAWMVKDCTKWLVDVEARIPSVVVTATDEVGAHVVDAAITADGNAFSSRLDGRAVEIDPGEHVFVLTLPDGRTATQRALVREGQKAQPVTA